MDRLPAPLKQSHAKSSLRHEEVAQPLSAKNAIPRIFEQVPPIPNSGPQGGLQLGDVGSYCGHSLKLVHPKARIHNQWDSFTICDFLERFYQRGENRAIAVIAEDDGVARLQPLPDWSERPVPERSVLGNSIEADYLLRGGVVRARQNSSLYRCRVGRV